MVICTNICMVICTNICMVIRFSQDDDFCDDKAQERGLQHSTKDETGCTTGSLGEVRHHQRAEWY